MRSVHAKDLSTTGLLLVSFCILGSLSLVGCSGTVTVSREIQEQRVEGDAVRAFLSGLLEEISGAPVSLELDIDTDGSLEGAGAAQSAHMQTVSLRITETARSSANDEDNFDFLDSIEIYLSNPQDAPELPRVKIAELPQVPTGQTTLELETDDSIDVLPYAGEGAEVTFEGQGNSPTDDVTFAGSYTLLLTIL